MRGYNRKYGQSRRAMKIDLQNAYDTINWKFINQCLKCFGLHEKMVGWIMKCITTSTISIDINGELHGHFKGARGLRQGDPISLYLFTLVMEVFSLMLKRRVEQGNQFKYYWGCKEMKLTHLNFADDLLVTHGDVSSVQTIKDALDEFSKATGLLPNVKSTVFFGSVKTEVQEEIKNIIRFQTGVLPVR